MRALEGKIHPNCRAGPAYLRQLASGENARGAQCRQLSNHGRLAALRGDLQRLVAHFRFEECAPASLKYRPAKVGGLWCQLSRPVASSGAAASQWSSRRSVGCALRAPLGTAEQSASQAPPVTPSGNGRSRAPSCACAPETVRSERFLEKKSLKFKRVVIRRYCAQVSRLCEVVSVPPPPCRGSWARPCRCDTPPMGDAARREAV